MFSTCSLRVESGRVKVWKIESFSTLIEFQCTMTKSVKQKLFPRFETRKVHIHFLTALLTTFIVVLTQAIRYRYHNWNIILVKHGFTLFRGIQINGNVNYQLFFVHFPLVDWYMWGPDSRASWITSVDFLDHGTCIDIKLMIPGDVYRFTVTVKNRNGIDNSFQNYLMHVKKKKNEF